MYVDGLYLRRNWGGEFENMAILADNADGYREVLHCPEGMKEDKASRGKFLSMAYRGLSGAQLIVNLGTLETAATNGEIFPEAKYQWCTVHFYRNVFLVLRWKPQPACSR